MRMTGQAIRLDATGTAQGNGPGTLLAAVLTAGDAADASAVVRDGGAAGRILFTLKAVQKTSVCFNAHAAFVTDIHVTLAGGGAEMTVVIW